MKLMCDWWHSANLLLHEVNEVAEVVVISVAHDRLLQVRLGVQQSKLRAHRRRKVEDEDERARHDLEQENDCEQNIELKTHIFSFELQSVYTSNYKVKKKYLFDYSYGFKQTDVFTQCSKASKESN